MIKKIKEFIDFLLKDHNQINRCYLTHHLEVEANQILLNRINNRLLTELDTLAKRNDNL